MTITEYERQKNADLIVAQHPDVQAAASNILATIHDAWRYLYWSMDPEEKDGGAYDCQQLLDYAHQLVDQAHAYRAALKAAPLKGDQ